jgi:hypothetical protein
MPQGDARPDPVPPAVLPAVLPAVPPAVPSSAAGGIRRVILIRRRSAPTDELYVLAGLEPLAARHPLDLRIVDLEEDESGPGERDALLCDGAVVVVSRYLTRPWLDSLARREGRLGRILYLMDDDVTLAEADPTLPRGYRERMAAVAHGEFQALLHLASGLVVSSEVLAGRFASGATALLTPPYLHPCPDLRHFDDPSEIRIEYHGKLAHEADLGLVAGALRQLHDRYPHVRIRTFMGDRAPAALAGLGRVENVPELPWGEYRVLVAGARAHIALAPLLATPFNTAKSFVKIMDIARLGAAGLYSRRPPYEGVVSHGRTGLLLEADARAWQEALHRLVEAPEEIRRLAEGGQDLARRLSRKADPEAFWERRILGSGGGPGEEGSAGGRPDG